MSKLTRLIAGSITAVIAVGAFAVPATAAEESDDSIETALCEAIGPDIDEFTGIVADGVALLAEQADTIDETKADMDDSTTDLATTALAYIRALDGVGDEDETKDAFVDAAGVFGQSVVDWVVAVDEHADNTIDTGIYEAVLNYMKGLCPVA